ncbi:MAG: amidohydrolase family protein [Planctomycetota bacterium]
MGWVMALLGVPAIGQTTRPVVGLRDTRPGPIALVGGRVVVDPESAPQPLTVLIHHRQIVAVGPEVDLPPGTEIVDLDGHLVYAGFIDACRSVDVPWESDRASSYWNANVTPRRHANSVIKTLGDMKDYRAQGVTMQLIAPQHRIIQGRSAIVLTSVDESGEGLNQSEPESWADPNWQHLQLTVPRQRTTGESYPNSPMGATALVRQSLYDAKWYGDAWDAYRANSELSRPESNLDLETLSGSISESLFVIDAPNERMAIRGGDVADEFSLRAIFRGSGREYRALAQLQDQRRAILLPVNFPESPNVNTDASARDVDLRTMLHWYFAPRNPKLLDEAGIEYCFISDGLDNASDYLSQIRKAVEVGLPKSSALAAMTTTPAKLLGIANEVGTIAVGKIANLVVTDGDVFGSETNVIQTWVAGTRFDIESLDSKGDDPLPGLWKVKLGSGDPTIAFDLRIEKDGKKWSATIETRDPDEEAEIKKLRLRKVLRQRHRVSGLVDLQRLGDQLDRDLGEGVASLDIAVVPDSESKKKRLSGTWTDVDGLSRPMRLTKRKSKLPVDDPIDEADSSSEDVVAESFPILSPLGAYGRAELPSQPSLVLFRGGMVWTCDGQRPRVQDILIADGKIIDIGEHLDVPDGTQIVDVREKHLTPGLIDCHSHMATDGGVNESGQAITAEVRIGDFIDNTDITIYRQLAGGVTTSNIMHGSANPIGGQNQVIKLRWGGTMNEMRFKNAPAGIKFALGENVKRSRSRYPNTRMGVEQIIRDQFLAARHDASLHRRYAAGDRTILPPRRNLQLEAMTDIQRGNRWIHCHSYRQDEIVATLDVLEEFGVQIGTLQHILEGYKVADRIADHGAMASSFADWWAYKLEVFDAIPFNGVLMHDAGVVVSYNSDDAELGRHLNTEAAKAVKYGGVPPHEALQFVTLNAAKQLRIDDRIGSIESGKDADLVVWSGPPLSTLSRCEQTWIDGRSYFDLDDDAALRQRDQSMRSRLIQLIRAEDAPSSKPSKEGSSVEGKETPKSEQPDEEARWSRYDEFCTLKGARQ